MKRFQSRLGMAVVGVALAAAPALAGQRPHDSGTGSASSDHAVARGGDGGGSAARAGGGSAASGGSSSGASSTAPSSIASSPSSGGAERSAPMYAEPQRRGGGGGSASSGSGSSGSGSSGSSHRGGGNGSGDHAVPRGGGSSSRGTAKSGGETKSGGDSTTSGSSSGRTNAAPSRDNGEAVPSWSRPRGDRPATDGAANRVGARPDPNHRTSYGHYYDPFLYNSYYGYGPYGNLRYPGFGLGYGYGLGLGWPLFYDPWYDPGYATSGFGSYGYGGMSGYSGYSSNYGADQGKMRLKVKPRTAKVYVDGYFVGNVDEFDGAFQKLALNGGRHRVEVKAEGYETAEFDVLIMPDETVTYQGELKKIQ
jgi:PEGA domain-containing protein